SSSSSSSSHRIIGGNNPKSRTILVVLLASLLILSSLASSSVVNADEATCADSGTTAAVDDDEDDDPITARLLDWLRENGAYINEKLIVRRVDPNDVTSPRGVFATDDIDVGETVCAIPWNLMIKPSEGVNPNISTEDDCLTLDATYDAIRGGDRGEITPYARYLLAQPRDYLPSFWSEAARDLLGQMLRSTRANHLTKSDQLPPRGVDDLIARDVMDWCDIPSERMSDPLFRQAVMLVKARADYHYMVPFYDMMNHHNGRHNTAHKYNPYGGHGDGVIKENGYEMITTRKIKKSEEVYNSYNRCIICDTYVDHVGTPEIFYNWGFVEDMPQRWLFDFARVKFDLNWRNDDDGEPTGDLVATFLVPPSERGIALLQEELDRLSSFETIRDADPKDRGIPASEWTSLWQYYDALSNALRVAVHQSRDGSMTDEVWKLDDNWWVKDGALTADDDEDHYVYPIINA
ncbi:hypothetical protein ACHAXA_011741, partial [Cyclostephanos tholiformis]